MILVAKAINESIGDGRGQDRGHNRGHELMTVVSDRGLDRSQ